MKNWNFLIIYPNVVKCIHRETMSTTEKILVDLKSSITLKILTKLCNLTILVPIVPSVEYVLRHIFYTRWLLSLIILSIINRLKYNKHLCIVLKYN